MAQKKPKKPKAPKTNASLEIWQNYQKRLSEWKKKCQKIESDKKKKANLIAKVRRSA